MKVMEQYSRFYFARLASLAKMNDEQTRKWHLSVIKMVNTENKIKSKKIIVTVPFFLC